MVVDAHSYPLNPTYPKRAKQIVKQGRAEWVDENTIRILAGLPEGMRAKNVDTNQLLDAIKESNDNILGLLKQIMERLNQQEGSIKGDVKVENLTVTTLKGHVTANTVSIDGDGTVNIEGDVEKITSDRGSINTVSK